MDYNMTEIDRTEGMRKLLDLTLASGRVRQSPNTGFVHYTYHALDGEDRDSIPLVENFLFALALLRMRTSEAVAEGKALLDKLLHFQNSDGQKANFPVYLHEYPECKDRYVAAHLLPIFYWVLKKFQQILGADLRERMETTAQLLLAHCLQNYQERVPGYSVAIKIAAAEQAFAQLKEGSSDRLNDHLLESLRANAGSNWHCPTQIADTLVALQMVYPTISDSPWSPFWNAICETWHRETCSYSGPAVKELEAGFEPQATLYDLYLGYLSGKFSARALKGHPYQLQGALIQSCSDPLINVPQKGYAFSLFVKEDNGDKGYYPFRLLWGNEKRVHTFACSKGNATLIEMRETSEEIELKFHLPDPVNLEEREKNRDVAFYMDLHEEIKLLINGHASNTFRVGDLVSLSSGELQISLKFSVEEGADAEFFGHWMLGNRPSQVSVKGENRFQAYDWQLFLRAVKRTGPCVVKVNVKINKI